MANARMKQLSLWDEFKRPGNFEISPRTLKLMFRIYRPEDFVDDLVGERLDDNNTLIPSK